MAMTVVKDPTATEMSTVADGSALTSSSSPTSTSQPTGKSKWTIDENENLLSTSEHRMYVFGSMALMAGSLGQAAVKAQAMGGPAGWIGIGTAVMAAYVLSDLGTGDRVNR